MEQVSKTSHLEKYADIFAHVRRGRMIAGGAVAIILIYIGFALSLFDLPGVMRRWDPNRAALFAVDLIAYKNHVNYSWEDPNFVQVRFEGSSFYTYDEPPGWVGQGRDNSSSRVTFTDGSFVEKQADRVIIEGFGEGLDQFEVAIDDKKKPYVVGYQDRLDALPDWIRVTESKVEIRPSVFKRVQVYGRKIEIHRYEFGWAYFWFDFHSPLVGMNPLTAINLLFSDTRVVTDRSNADLVWDEFVNNEMWLHGKVFFALLETLMMAILGTAFASFLGLPLAFLAAKNVAPFAWLRFVSRRTFDLFRGIDMLIWSLIFLRAFGPGLFTGIFAIGLTDTGTLGKLMSEAIENANKKDVEGVRATGASRLQQHRFGIIPQILPVFISQSLYYFESNTRSAVIIGAMGAGGIGTLFLSALQTGSDFENVAYLSLLVLILVIIIDAISGYLRRALIKYDH
ncbi:MAG: phosphonate ABC transporter, permease protein PhnE [Alphaproteobacteria bacterium]